MGSRGRIDAQIKIRGFRIKLARLRRYCASARLLREVVVISRGEKPAEQRLVAYVVPTRQAPTISDLNGFLRHKLPEYMVPSIFVFLESLPLTSNGKINSRNLRIPTGAGRSRRLFVPPRTPVEELLAQILAEVLKFEQVGIHDNFFELGGHSLSLTQVASLGSSTPFWCCCRWGSIRHADDRRPGRGRTRRRQYSRKVRLKWIEWCGT